MIHEMQYVEMRDGVKLFTNIWKPDEGKHPVLLTRSPYTAPQNYAVPPKESDFVYIQQVCRGTAASEGEIEPYVFERQDGLDTLAWIRRQPFYDGNIYTSGQSYLCTTQLIYLDTCPADVRASALCVQDVRRYNMHYENGQYKIGLHLRWAIERVVKRYPELLQHETFDECVKRLCATLPMVNFGKALFGSAEKICFDETLKAFRHPREDDIFWETDKDVCEANHALDNLDMPVLLTTSYFDIYTYGCPKMWAMLKPETRKKSMMIISPNNHHWSCAGAGMVQHPNDRHEICNQMIEWESSPFLKAVRTGNTSVLGDFEMGKINYYVLFGNRWETEDMLPEGTHPRKWYLGDKALTDASQNGESTYVYNPDDPTPFNGSCGNLFGFMQAQDGVGTRSDRVSFVSAPLNRDMTVKGFMRVHLNVRTDCEDTAFYVRFSVIRKDGTAYGLRDRITGLCYVHPDYTPGDVAVLDLPLDFMAFEVHAGEQLRLDVASSLKDGYYPHCNKKGLWCEQTEKAVAHNTVVWDGSYVELPEE